MALLFVLPSLEDVPAGPELRRLLDHFPHERGAPRFIVLDRGDGPTATSIRESGCTVLPLAATHWVDLRAWKALRNDIRQYEPTIIHAFGAYALRLTHLARLRTGIVPRLYFTDLGDAAHSANYLQRWLPANETVVERGESAIPYGPLPTVAPWQLPDNAGRNIACDGAYDKREEWVVALRSFDFLKLIYPDVRFHLSGSGPMVRKLEIFGEQIGAGEVRFRFVGRCCDLPAFFARSIAVWLPSAQPGVAQRALTAMEAGRPVIAVRCPETEAVVRHDVTGWLFEPGDYVMLAKYTRRLLDQPGLAESMGAAARVDAETRFPASRVVQGFLRLYDLCD